MALGGAAAAAVVLVVAAVLVVYLVETDLRRRTSATLQDALEEQAARLGGVRSGQETAFDVVVNGRRYQLGLFDELAEGNAGGRLVVDGEPIALLEIDLDRDRLVTAADLITGEPITDPTTLDDLQSLMFDVIDITADGGERTVVVGAASTERIDAATDAVRQSLAVAVPLLVLVSAGLAWLLAGRSLRPVGEISDRAARLSIDDLHQRVPVPAGDDEVARLANVVNDMLARLEVGAAGRQRFAADASHEMRTPLSTIRVLAESMPPPADGSRDPGLGIVEQVDRLDALIADLLVLASTDGRLVDREPVDLHRLVDDVVADMELTVAIQRLEARSTPMISGNPRLLRRVVANLLANADRHGDAQVVIDSTVGEAAVHLAFEDDGCGVAPEDRDRVFDPFVRLDESRSRNTGSFGLGLAIVDTVVRAHGGRVTLEDPIRLGGARFVVELPVVVAEPDVSPAARR
jgi:signal transduction histidine kinase